MRVVIDANVFLSYLLHPDRHSSACQVARRAIAGEFELIFPREIAEEIRTAVSEKRYFRERIPSSRLDTFMHLIADIAVAPNLASLSPVSSRDPEDQYLLDAAADNVAFLITGDRDLLDDRETISFTLIVSAAQFLSLFEQSHLL